jgi:gephyrin
MSQSDKNTIKINLVSTNTSQALLVLSPNEPSSHRKASSLPRASVLVVPFTVPVASTIANAMGRGPSGAKWLAKQQHVSNDSNYDPVRLQLLDTMRSAMEQNRPQAANTAFFEWEKRERDNVETGDSEGTKEGVSPHNNAKSVSIISAPM